MYAALAGDGLADLKSLKDLHRDFTAYFEDEGADELRVFISHLSKPNSQVQKNGVPARRSAIDAEETAKMTLALETWLLEIAPLVRAHHWGYPDILLIAKDKFDHEHELVLTTGQIRSRCEKVGLRLSPKAQNGGRPSNARKLALRKSLAAQMASALKSTGEGGDEWMLGQRGLCGNSTARPWAEKGNLFTIVGTDDPGPERIWL